MTAKRSFAVAVVLVTAVVLAATHPATGAASNRAGVVVRYDNERVERMCVAFEEPSISGLELLERADVPFLAERSAIGSAICRIGERGCEQDDCFCEYPSFWGYWTRAADDEWTFADVGAADRDVRDGDMDGWSWGKDGEPAPPASADFADVCSTSARDVRTTSRAASPDATSGRPNYVPFAGFAMLLALAAVVLARRRRRV